MHLAALSSLICNGACRSGAPITASIIDASTVIALWLCSIPNGAARLLINPHWSMAIAKPIDEPAPRQIACHYGINLF